MESPVLSVVMLGLCLLIYAGYILYGKVIQPKKAAKEKAASQLSANIWTNVTDIIDDAILTNDDLAISVYQITPVNIDLLTSRDKTDFVKAVASSVSSIKRPYKLLAVPQPYDVQPYIDELTEQKHTASDIQKLIIANEISYINSMVASGTMVEKRFYLLVWDNIDDEYRKNREDFIRHWQDSRRIELTMLKQQELMQLCNLIFNPSVSDEIYDNAASLPMIRS